MQEDERSAQEREAAEWEQLRREAGAIDPNQYRRRGRIMAAVGFGALGAAVVWAVMGLTDSARNPCQRVRDHCCGKDPRSAACASYQGILRESTEDSSGTMRSMVREQCLTKIRRLKEEDGIEV